MNVLRLQPDDLGPGTDNPGRVDELREATDELDGGIPFLLLPVRLETRFGQREVPAGDHLSGMAKLIRQLEPAATALEELAQRNLSTVLQGTVREKRRFKQVVEAERYTFVRERLDAVAAALDRAVSLLHDPLDGADEEMTAVDDLLRRLQDSLQAAVASVARLRAAFWREEFTFTMAELAERVASLIELIHTQVQPTIDLLKELRVPRVGRAEVGLSRTRIRETAEAYAAVDALLGMLEARLGEAPPPPSRLMQRATTLAEAILDAAARVAEGCGVIAVLPTGRKTRLTETVAYVAARGDEVARQIEAGAAGGGAATVEAVALAEQLRTALTSIERAVEDLRTDIDPGLAVHGPTRVVDQLWVRVYPDDCAVHTFERALTTSELEAGRTFWRATRAAAGDEALARGAWRALCRKHGSSRAAWIARQTEPPKDAVAPSAKAHIAVVKALETLDKRLDEVAGAPPGARVRAVAHAVEAVEASLDGVTELEPAALERSRALTVLASSKLVWLRSEARRWRDDASDWLEVTDGLDRVGDLIADITPADAPDDLADREDVPLKQAGWTTASTSPVLPDRFVIVTVSGGRVSHVVAGEPVAADLKLSLDPDPADADQERFGLDDDGNLVVGASIRWMTDYDEAVAKGMAVTVPITPEEARGGFDRVYAVGTRFGTADEGCQRLQALLDNHHYGQSGLALAPISTPTNNSERDAAGYRSIDDPDESYRVERAGPLFDDSATGIDAADGLRLARALGVEPACLANVAHADGTDIAETLRVNAALWPATLGHAFEEMLGPLLSLDARARVKAFALGSVAARGLVPSLRIGAQPYGVLPTTAYSLLLPAAGPTVAHPNSEEARQARFDRILRGVLAQMHEDWTRLRQAHVKHAHSDGVTDMQQHFLDMLGLHATSVDLEYRFALNVVRRHGWLGFSVSVGDLKAAEAGPVGLLQRFAAVFREAFGLADVPVIEEGQVSLTFSMVYARLLHSRGYDLRFLRAPRDLRGVMVGADPERWLPVLVGTAPRELALAANSGQGGPYPLLYLLLRHALLLQFREAALGILRAENMLDEEAQEWAGASDGFTMPSLVEGEAVTRWSYLFAPLNRLDGAFGINFPSGPGSFYEHMGGRDGARPSLTMDGYVGLREGSPLFLAFPGHARHEPFMQPLRDHAALVGGLVGIAPDRLERLAFEHLDMCSYRLDAWLTGLAYQRLAQLRATAPTGIYLGAYGWVEDLRPDIGHPAAGDVPPVLAGDGSTVIHRDPENQGFLHAPSMNHAVTAAILRSGYLSVVGQPDIENRMAVNLSSRRVRLALDLIDGVRAGNDLGALLGYQFERFLHDAHAGEGVTLDDLIAPFRRGWPSTAAVNPALATADTARRLVVDGLALVQTVLDWVRDNRDPAAGATTLFEILRDGGNYSGYPFGLHGAGGEQVLPPITGDTRRLDSVLRAIDRIADALDAVADLVLSEAIHQIGQGNHARASAALAALAEGHAPPRPELVESPSQGTLVAHRLFLQLAPVDGRTLSEPLDPDAARAALPPAWADLPATPRACAEPSLNRWLGGQLGAPQDIRAEVVEDDGTPVAEVTVADLELQPVDLLAMLGPGFDQGLAELTLRLLDTQRPADVDDTSPLPPRRVELGPSPGWPIKAKSFLEVAPLLEAVGQLVGRGRPATPADYALAQQVGEDGGVEVQELKARASAAEARLRAVGVRLLKFLSDGADDDPALLDGEPSLYLARTELVHRMVVDDRRVFRDLDAFWARRADIRTLLLDVSAFGIPHALPPRRYESREAVARELLETAEAAFVEVANRARQASSALATGAATDAVAAVFGQGFPLLPQFVLGEAAELIPALAGDPPASPEVEGWLHGVAAVRQSAAALAQALLLGDAFGAPAAVLRPLQFPFVAGEPWLGVELPPGAAAPATDKLSLVLVAPDKLAVDGGASVGLLVDQWVEIVPAGEQTTGVAFHYDQPDAMPPQCLLLAVAPERGWRWDHLVQILHDTLELAKNRAVELDHLHRDDLYAQLLPGVIGEFIPYGAIPVAAQVPGARVLLDFGANNPRPGGPA